MRTVEGACRADCTESFMSSIDPGVMWLHRGGGHKKGVRLQRRRTLRECSGAEQEVRDVVLVNMRDQGGARHVGQSAEHAVPKINHKPRRRRRR
jgi:hypothetical protein